MLDYKSHLAWAEPLELLLERENGIGGSSDVLDGEYSI